MADTLYYIRKGCLRLFFWNDGKDCTFQFFFEGDFVASFDSMYRRQPSLFSLESIEPSEQVPTKRHFNRHLLDSRCAAHCKTIQQREKTCRPRHKREGPAAKRWEGLVFSTAGWSCVTFLALMSEREMYGVLHVLDYEVHTNCSAILGYI